MPVVELIMAVCLIASPDKCTVERFQFYENASLYGCMLRAVPYMADWAEKHPAYEVKSWKCGYPNPNKDRDA